MEHRQLRVIRAALMILYPNRTLKDLINHLNSLSDDDLGTENLGLQVKLNK